ncbi:hypothetical protein [Bacteroides reticulotermitis]|uniref:Uncharacterized protein n=2 Tax=Bacteroides reticulotermitis TaxID=1133319 RepID=W4UQA9_9BACE|nr:hypothetical protein [Bacteroides reticulotermitis]MBB4043850.1 AcrR family transcriptional regulator [Bacteroides reticulotermitis]GAE83365.1 hypothetical protein JCM10512_1633 [Bacteroides reticulotermitis JCM 10512]
MNEKLYFRDKESVFVECLDDILSQAIEDAAREVDTMDAHNMSLCEECGGQIVDTNSILKLKK